LLDLYQPVALRGGGELLIAAPSLKDSRLIRIKLARLHSRISNAVDTLWPKDALVEVGGEQMTLVEFLIEEFAGFCAQLSRLLKAEALLEQRDWIDLITADAFFEFFIATEPVPHWEQHNAERSLLPGLCQLQQLLGDSYPVAPIEVSTDVCTSGDGDADLLAALCLRFKGTCAADWDSHPAILLHAILVQANNIWEKANKDSKPNKPRRLAPRRVTASAERSENPEFMSLKSRFIVQLQQWNIPVPEEL
jgi:hypothetical protein